MSRQSFTLLWIATIVGASSLIVAGSEHVAGALYIGYASGFFVAVLIPEIISCVSPELSSRKPAETPFFDVGWEPSFDSPAAIVVFSVGLIAFVMGGAGHVPNSMQFLAIAGVYMFSVLFSVGRALESAIGTRRMLILSALTLAAALLVSFGREATLAIQYGVLFGTWAAFVSVRLSVPHHREDRKRAAIVAVLSVSCLVVLFLALQYAQGTMNLVAALASCAAAWLGVRLLGIPAETVNAWKLQERAPDGVTWNYDAVTGRLTFVGSAAYALAHGYVRPDEYAFPSNGGRVGQGPISELDPSTRLRTGVPLTDVPA